LKTAITYQAYAVYVREPGADLGGLERGWGLG